MRIAIDIDSTLHHYWDQLEDIARRRFGVALPYEDQVMWHIERFKPEQLTAPSSSRTPRRSILASEPYPGAVEAVRAWHDAGHFIHITSHRSGEAHDARRAWLRRIGLPFDELYCSYDKVTRCAEIGIDVLIDDSPDNLRARSSRHHARRPSCTPGTASCARPRTSSAARTGRSCRATSSRCSR